jgi:hypothetical protein
MDLHTLLEKRSAPFTLGEIRRLEKKIKCGNCRHWRTPLKGHKWTWRKCDVDGLNHRYNDRCLANDFEPALSRNIPMGGRR